MSTNTTSFQVDSKPPPPAPPLPPQRYGQRAATAIARLAHPFLYGSRPSSAHGHRESDIRPTGFRDTVPQSPSPLSSRNVPHKTGIPINALDVSPERTHVVLAGRDILKTVRVSDTSCAEDFNLRAHISAYASAHDASRDAVSAQHRDQLTASDVKWSHKLFNTTIATAATSGRIVIYDINRPSVEIARLHEHTRQVHRLAFNPYQGALLLSGSQDGTIRMWDLRALGDKSVRTVGSIKRFFGNSGGIRDVRWSPTDGVEFAIGTDNGVVQKWDFRKEAAPILKINAHDKACHSVDWHPSGRYLASAGADKQVKVWDFKSTDRRMRPSWLVRTPQNVLTARWRPARQNLGDGPHELRHTSQIATSYLGKDPRIHVWDFNRPHVPCQEFDRHESIASDFLWHSEDRLWSVGSAGMFIQTDMTSVPKPMESLNVNILSSAPDGKFCFFSDARIRRRISSADIDEELFEEAALAESSGEKFSSSQSANEGSVEEQSSLSTPMQIRRQKSVGSRLAHGRSSIASRETDPTTQEPHTLDDTFLSTQTGASGYVVGVFDPAAYSHLARHYQLPILREMLADTELPKKLRAAFEHNAMVSSRTGQYRLGQTWRIIGLASQRALEARAMKARKNKAQRFKPSRPNSTILESPPVVFDKVRFGNADENRLSTRSPTPHTLSQHESSSNIATPLARPAQGLLAVLPVDESLLTPTHDHQTSHATPGGHVVRPIAKTSRMDSDVSPSEMVPFASLSPKTQSIVAQENDSESDLPCFERLQGLELEVERRRSVLNDFRGQPRSVLRLDDPREDSPSPAIPMRVERHDSNESFQMFSASVESDPRSLPFVGSFGESRGSDASEQASVNLSTSMRQDLANSILTRTLSTRPEQRRPSAFLPPPHPPPSMPAPASASAPAPTQSRPTLERKESSGVDGATINVQVHETVTRPTYSPTMGSAAFPKLPTAKAHSNIRDDEPASNFLPNGRHEDDGEDHKANAPWALSSVLKPLMDYHIDTLCDVQFPSIVALYLAPLFPPLFSESLYTATYLRAYHQRLTSLGLNIEAAAFRKACAQHFPDVASAMILGAGVAALWCTTCEKPAKGVNKGWCERCETAWGPCGVCENVMPPNTKFAETIEHSMQVNHDSAWDEEEGKITDDKDDNGEMEVGKKLAGNTLWSWCQGCGHGGHDRCLRTWFTTTDRNLDSPDASEELSIASPKSGPATNSHLSRSTTTKPTSSRPVSPSCISPPADLNSTSVSEGICPVPFCGHDCMPGLERERKRRAMDREKSRARGAVAQDDWVAGESSAVMKARKMVSGAKEGSGKHKQKDSKGAEKEFPGRRHAKASDKDMYKDGDEGSRSRAASGSAEWSLLSQAQPHSGGLSQGGRGLILGGRRVRVQMGVGDEIGEATADGR